ncbi:MAG: hypothetical protein ACPGVU_00610 [Limisphaerales bacterium]
MRIVLLLAAFLLVAGFIWFNQVGMPEFAKTSLQEELNSRGLEVEFKRMYWKWFQGIVTEDLTVRPSEGRIGPSIQIQSADVDLDLNRLAKLDVSVTSIELYHGNGRWEVAVSNELPKILSIKKLNTNIRFLPDDRWQLTHFNAVVQDVSISASGIITNASLARRQSASTSRKRSPKQQRDTVERAEAQIYRAIKKFEEFKFAKPPVIAVNLNADARENGEVDARISGSANLLDSPFGECRNFQLNGQVTRSTETNSPIQARLSLGASAVLTDEFQSRQARGFIFLAVKPGGEWDLLLNTNFKEAKFPHGEADYIGVEGSASSDTINTNEVHANLSLTLSDAVLEQNRIGNLKLSTSITGDHRVRHVQVAELKGRINRLSRGDYSIEQLAFEGTLRTNTAPDLSTTHGWLVPWIIDLDLEGKNARDGSSQLQSIGAELSWHTPKLELESLKVEFPDGTLNADVKSDVESGLVDLNLTADFALEQITHLIGKRNAKYLSQYRFKSAPDIRLAGQLHLPEGDWDDLDWKRDLEPRLKATGSLTAGAGDYRGITFDSAKTDLSLTNQLLILPNLHIVRPEGELHLTYTNHLLTRDYSFGIDSLINIHVAAPVLGEGERKGLKYLTLNQEMPFLRGTLWGRWGDLSRTGLKAYTRMTNFAVRGQHVDRLEAKASMTNGLLVLTDIKAKRPEGIITSPYIDIDLKANRVFMTNVNSAVDFMFIPTIIGPKTAKAVSHYHFPKTPNVIINGSVGTGRDAEKEADLHFDLVAPHFHWFKFNLNNVVGRIDWMTNKLSITNLTAGFYGGEIEGDLFFDFDPPVGNDFTFDLTYTNASLRGLIADISNPTNRLEGRVSGDVNVTSGNTAYWDSWQGHGDITLTNAVLWDIPVFGMVSPVLNNLLPGVRLGNSRAEEAAGKFVMTNSIIRTEDLIIQSPPVRLYYRGTVDFDANIDARVEAKMFRDKLIMTRLLDVFTAPITKILEHKVTGTLGKPESEPLNELPKILLVPLKPLQIFQNILRGSGDRPKK